MRSWLTVPAVVAAVLFFFFGRAYQAAVTAWKTYQTTKASIPGLRRIAWGWLFTAAGRGVLGAAALVIIFLVAVNLDVS